jgi:hypothetical protein
MKSSSKPSRTLRNLALSSATYSPHSPSPMTADISTHADRVNLIVHNSHKRSSGAQPYPTSDRGNAKRIRQFWHQNDGAGLPLDDVSGKVIKPRGTQSISCLSRQHFTQFRLSPRMLRLVLSDVLPLLDC